MRLMIRVIIGFLNWKISFVIKQTADIEYIDIIVIFLPNFEFINRADTMYEIASNKYNNVVFI